MKTIHNRFNEKSFLQWSYSLTKTCLKSAMLAASRIVFFVTGAAADVLLMKNGDRLQGTVISMTLGKLVFKTSYAGEITIKWDEIASLTTKEPLHAYLRNEKTLMGKIKINKDGALILQPSDGSPPVPISMAQVKTLEHSKPPASWEFDGNVSAGVSKETGNTNTEKYSFIANATIHKFPHDIKLYAEFHKEWAKKKLSKDNALGSATYKRFLTRKWFAFGNGTAQMDQFADLDLLGNVAAGAGYQFYKSRELNLSALIGPAYVYEKYTKRQSFLDGKSQRTYFAGYSALDFDMWFFDKFFQIYHHSDLLYSFRNSENWGVRTRTGVRIPMVMKLFTSFQFNYDYNNQPADGKKKDDQSWVFGLGWAF
jgi:putative salt-induced outer membrane protein YdiY